jgi:death-on-curing protein
LGLRDAGLLESAMAQPRAEFSGQYLHRDVFEMAAAYLFHLVKNHPFFDGNKRVGAATASVFLHMNGQRFFASNDQYAAFVLAIASGRATKAEATQFFRNNCDSKPHSAG